MGASQYRPNQASLADKGEWLAYEIAMFRECAAHAEEARRDPDEFWTCLLTEGFALHLHTLLEFFFPRTAPDNEEAATVYDFLDKLRWDEVRPLDYTAFQDYECLAVRQVAHLTYYLPGVRLPAKGMSMRDCRDKMERLIDCYLRHLPPSRCGGHLAELKARAEA